MKLDFSDFDGLHSPREAQKRILDSIDKHLDDCDILIIQAPCGVGKSGLVRAVQKAVSKLPKKLVKGVPVSQRGIAITPDNLLVGQYEETYKDLNKFVGSTNYKCSDTLYDTCGSKKTAEGKCWKPCKNCPYADARNKFRTKTQDTVSNTQSFALSLKHKGAPDYEVVVIDEADYALSFLRNLAGISVSEDIVKAKPEDLVSVESVIQFLARVQKYYNNKLSVATDPKKKVGFERKLEHIDFVVELVENHHQRYAWFIEESKLTNKSYFKIEPVILPSSALKRIMGKRKTILLSATIFPSHVEEIVGDKVKTKLISADSPFEDWRQQIVYRRFPGGLDYQTPVKKVCEKIAKDIEEFGVKGKETPTLIHVAYSQRTEYVKHLKHLGIEAITHDKDDKIQVLEEWKKSGGVLVGAGMSTGIDLKDDLVRLQIIPRIVKGTGEVLEKYRALPNGWNKDSLRIAGGVLQTIGRGCRNPNDFCVTLCYDTYFLQLYNKMKKSKEFPSWWFKTVSITGKIHKNTPKDWREMFR